MAITLLTSRKDSLGANGGTSGTIDSSGASLLVVTVSSESGVAVSVSDSKSNSWTGLTYDGGTNRYVRIFYAWSSLSVGAGHTITVTGNSSFSADTFSAWSGTQTSSDPLDQQSNGAYQATAGNYLQTSSITPSVNNEVVIAGFFGSGAEVSLSIDSGMTIAQNQDFVGGASYADAMAYIVQTTATTIQPTWTQSCGATRGMIASFKAAAAGTGKLFRTPLLNGLGAGGPFFNNPLGRHRQPADREWMYKNGIYRKAA